jgi:hypothetical protein
MAMKAAVTELIDFVNGAAEYALGAMNMEMSESVQRRFCEAFPSLETAGTSSPE